MASEWYISTPDGHRGPFASSQLKRWAEEGKLAPDTFVRKGPQGKWVSAAQVGGLVFGDSERAPEQAATPAGPTSPPVGGPMPPLPPDASESASSSGADGLPHIEVDAPEASRRPVTTPVLQRPARTTRDRVFRQSLLVAAVSAGVGLVVVVFLVVALLSRRPGESSPGQGAAVDARYVGAPRPSAPSSPGDRKTNQSGHGQIVIDWPEDERSDAAIMIDGTQPALPEANPMVFRLPEGNHQITLQRRKYKPISRSISLKGGQPWRFAPTWQPVEVPSLPFQKEIDEWLERFDNARKDPAEPRSALVEDLTGQPWLKDLEMREPDVAARLHLEAARLLFAKELHDQTMRQVQRALNVGPERLDVLTLLELLVLHDRCRPAESERRKIVIIIGGEPPQIRGTGTGFCVARDGGTGYILTNRHVIEGAKQIMVQLHRQDAQVLAKLAKSDPVQDLALLKIQVPQDMDLKPIPLAFGSVHRGQGVCVLGYPEDGTNTFELTLTDGIVSSERAGEDMIKTNCDVGPGNSGGPLLSSRAAAVGMITQRTPTTSRRSGVGLAIPTDRIRAFVGSLLPPESIDQPHDDARKEMPWEQVDQARAPSVVMILNIQ